VFFRNLDVKNNNKLSINLPHIVRYMAHICETSVCLYVGEILTKYCRYYYYYYYSHIVATTTTTTTKD